MWTVCYEWGSLLLRWTHIVAGIAWIGSSFYFMHLDAAIKAIPEIPKGKGGKPVPAGLFQSAADGTAMHVLPGPMDVAGTAAVAVTLERAAGATEPNLPPVFAAGL